jgi:hypothetical protein
MVWLFPVFLHFSASDTNLTVDDVAVGILSGKELLMTRFLAQAQSWAPTFRRVFVYSDAFPNTTKQDISASSPHADIQYVALPGLAEHIIGSQWLLPWYQAQPRFLPGMHHLWRTNPNVLWYIFGDDDTYFYIRNILRRLAKLNSSEPAVLSFFWCTWNTITLYMEPERDCHPFAQGGSGVILSKTVMDLLGPHLLACSEMYNDAEHAASMRVSVCMERLFGYENWTKSAFIKAWRSGIHPSAPSVTIGFGNTWDPPGTFHQVTPEEMIRLKNGQIVQDVDGFWDFAGFAFRSIPVEITYRRVWQMHFGYSIDSYGTHTHRLYGASGIETNDGGKTFQQRFDGGVKVVIKCDPNMAEDVIVVDEIERGVNVTIWLLLDCPKKRPYYN